MSDSALPALGTEGGSRPLRSLLLAVVLFLVLLLATFGLKGWQDVTRVRAREVALENGIAATETRIAELRAKIERMKGDPLTLDQMAREELGLVAPDDVVIVLPPPPPDAPPAPVPETP